MNSEQQSVLLVIVVILLVVMIGKELYFLGNKIFSKISRMFNGDPNEPATLGQLKEIVDTSMKHQDCNRDALMVDIKQSFNSGVASLKLDIVDLKRIGSETRDAVLELVAVVKDRKERGGKIL